MLFFVDFRNLICYTASVPATIRRLEFMDDKISYENAMRIAEQYAKRIRAELDSQAEVYLFGSIVTATNNPKSDIDIAVVSRVFTNDVCKNYAQVNMLAYDIDDSIDAQAIIYEDWIDQTPFTAAVQRQGVLVS
jgi:predicted nucleotidyltransferase